MKPLEKTAEDLFQTLRARFSPVIIGDEKAEVTTDPQQARFFSFVYEENGEPRGTVSISIINNRSLKVYFSHDMVENITRSSEWFGLLKELRYFAKRNLLSFDARDIQKDQLDTRDFDFIKQHDGPYKETDVEITESAMYGSKRKSMQKFENATLVVYHKRTVDEEKRGARSRHIDSIFIESNHERFRFPINYLNGARAMAVHVSEGGTPYDAIGQHIITTVSEMQNLAKFARMTRRHAMEDAEAATIRDRVIETYHGIKKDIMRMQNVNNYRAFAETFEPTEASGEADVSSLQEKFTRKVWNEQMTDLLPSVQRALEAKVDESRMADMMIAASEMSKEEFAKKYPGFAKDYEELRKRQMDEDTAHKLNERSPFENYRNSIVIYDPATMEVKRTYPITHGKRASDDAKRLDLIATTGDDFMELVKNKNRMSKDPRIDEASPSVEKTIKDPNFVLVLKKDETADRMIRTTKFTQADGLLAFIMSDIASRIIGDGVDAVANFASEMALNIGDEGAAFGTKITPQYKRDKQLAMLLAKKYLNDIKQMATDDDYAATVRKDPSEVYGAKKKRSGGYHESVAAFESWAAEIFEATVGTVGTVGTVDARTNPQVVKAISGGDPKKARDIKRVSDKLARGQKLTPSEMPIAGEIAKSVMTTKKPTAAMQALAQDEYTEIGEDYEGASVEDIAGALIWRIRRDKDLIKKIFDNADIEQLMDAIYAVAEFHEGAEELGSSDISIMVKQVLGQLGISESIVVEKTLKVKADRDYDGDGEIESPDEEYMGSRDRAIKASMKKKHNESDDEVDDDADLVRESLALLKHYAGI